MKNGAMFSAYAEVYDLFYRDKDYASEAAWVDQMLRNMGTPRGVLIDLGCGTGGHVRPLAELGWQVTGVDPSESMLKIARDRGVPERVSYVKGSAESFEVDRPADAVVSLFHVASYLTSPGGLGAMLARARAHLCPGGALMFDFWHGAGVRADPPARRERELEHDGLCIRRVATPDHSPELQEISVRYDIAIHSASTVQPQHICEVHRMRYYFLPEILTELARHGFEFVCSRAGLSDEPVGDDSWYVLVMARAR